MLYVWYNNKQSCKSLDLIRNMEIFFSRDFQLEAKIPVLVILSQEYQHHRPDSIFISTKLELLLL